MNIELFVGCTFLSISLYIMGSLLFQKEIKLKLINIIYILMLGLVMTISNGANPNIIDNVLKIIIIFAVCIGFYKLVFKENIEKVILASFIAYLIVFFSEVITDIIYTTMISIFDNTSLRDLKDSILANTIVSFVNVGITYIIRNKLSKMIKETNSSIRIVILISIIILITLSLLIFRTPIDSVKLDSNFIITMILLILFCIIGFVLIKQRHESDSLIDKYIKLANYSQNNEGLLEEYRENLHESNNQLILIDNMVPKKYKDVHEYIATLLEKNKKKKYYFLNDLKYLPLNELKGFMNFKIIEMINQNLDVQVNVSKEIKKTFFKKFKVSDKDDLYSIVGVLLDNARDAALESKEKIVSIEIFMNHNDLKLIIANTYKGKVDLDRIDEYGYTTKGAKHGTGLHIVNRIIKKNELFDKETSIIDTFFTQIITIHKK